MSDSPSTVEPPTLGACMLEIKKAGAREALEQATALLRSIRGTPEAARFAVELAEDLFDAAGSDDGMLCPFCGD